MYRRDNRRGWGRAPVHCGDVVILTGGTVKHAPQKLEIRKPEGDVRAEKVFRVGKAALLRYVLNNDGCMRVTKIRLKKKNGAERGRC